MLIFPKRTPSAKKGDAGKVLILGGSQNIHGAPILAALGALSAGVDLVSLALPKKHAFVARNKNLNFIVREFFEDSFSISDADFLSTFAKEWADSVVIGCGFFDAELPAVLHFLKLYSKNIVIDAGALQPEILPIINNRNNVLLTPHGGEFHRVFSCADSPQNVQKMAKDWGICILKKGMEDIIASSDSCTESATGCPEMSVGGTGDALAGLCGGLLARGLSPFESAILAAKHWGETGERLAQKQRVFSAEEMGNESMKI